VDPRACLEGVVKRKFPVLSGTRTPGHSARSQALYTDFKSETLETRDRKL